VTAAAAVVPAAAVVTAAADVVPAAAVVTAAAAVVPAAAAVVPAAAVGALQHSSTVPINPLVPVSAGMLSVLTC